MRRIHDLVAPFARAYAWIAGADRTLLARLQSRTWRALERRKTVDFEQVDRWPDDGLDTPITRFTLPRRARLRLSARAFQRLCPRGTDRLEASLREAIEHRLRRNRRRYQVRGDGFEVAVELDPDLPGALGWRVLVEDSDVGITASAGFAEPDSSLVRVAFASHPALSIGAGCNALDRSVPGLDAFILSHDGILVAAVAEGSGIRVRVNGGPPLAHAPFDPPAQLLFVMPDGAVVEATVEPALGARARAGGGPLEERVA